MLRPARRTARPGPPAALRRSAVGAALVGLGGCNEFSLRRQVDDLPSSVAIEERVEQAPLAAVDLLWVVDDTPSMASAQEALKAALVGFTAALDAQGIHWQIGVVTAALDAEAPGALIGQPWILRPGLEGAEDALLDAISSTGGRDPTGGLGVAALALREPLRSGANRGFRRADAALQVIVVSDDDDQSEDILGDDPVEATLALLEEEAAATGRAARLSAIVGAPRVGCSGVDGTALPGDRYAAVAEQSGGLLGNVCAADLRPVVESLGELSVELPTRFPLQAAPLDGSLQVSVDSEETTAFLVELDPPVVVFDEAPPAGATIRLRYRAAEAP